MEKQQTYDKTLDWLLFEMVPNSAYNVTRSQVIKIKAVWDDYHTQDEYYLAFNDYYTQIKKRSK